MSTLTRIRDSVEAGIRSELKLDALAVRPSGEGRMPNFLAERHDAFNWAKTGKEKSVKRVINAKERIDWGEARHRVAKYGNEDLSPAEYVWMYTVNEGSFIYVFVNSEISVIDILRSHQDFQGTILTEGNHMCDYSLNSTKENIMGIEQCYKHQCSTCGKTKHSPIHKTLKDWTQINFFDGKDDGYSTDITSHPLCPKCSKQFKEDYIPEEEEE